MYSDYQGRGATVLNGAATKSPPPPVIPTLQWVRLELIDDVLRDPNHRGRNVE